MNLVLCHIFSTKQLDFGHSFNLRILFLPLLDVLICQLSQHLNFIGIAQRLLEVKYFFEVAKLYKFNHKINKIILSKNLQVFERLVLIMNRFEKL